MARALQDGVHLRLSEERYFGLDALGSTDLIRLHFQKEGWWWSSRYNPDYVRQENDALNFGHALHTITLEGMRAYRRRFSVAPDKRDYEGLCCTADEIRAALAERGIDAQKSATKPKLIALIQEHAPDVPLWDAIYAEFESSLAPGQEVVTAAEDRQLRVMATAVRTHPELGPLFKRSREQMPLSEVSVIWTTPDGIRRRARFDALLPIATGDLKSIGNWSGRPLAFEVGKVACDRGYDIQMADYQAARRITYQFIRAGKVFGGRPAERRWLKRFPDEAQHWGWFWLFYQKPDSTAGRAPIVFPWWEDFGSDLHRFGHRKAVRALNTYRDCMARFGRTVPWTRVEPIHVTTEGAADRVFVPHYIADDDPVPGEDLELAA